MKFISLVASGAGQDRAQLNEWVLHEFAPQIARNGSRCAVNVLHPAESAASVDLVLETWGDSPGFIKSVHAPALLQRADVVSYQVTELVEKDELRTSGAPTPAVKLIAARPRTGMATVAECGSRGDLHSAPGDCRGSCPHAWHSTGILGFPRNGAGPGSSHHRCGYAAGTAL